MPGAAKPIVPVLCLCLQLLAGAAAAQTGPLIIDSNRADREPPAPEAKPPSPTGAAATTTLAEPARSFVLKAVQLENATAPATAVNAAFRPFIGRSMDAKALNDLTNAAAAAYAHTDVALYTIVLPNQTFAGGVVRMQVVEGFIQDVQVKATGDAKWDLPLARRIAARMLKERPLHKSTLQRAILLIRDVPGLSADVQFLRGTVPGAVVLQIALKRKMFELGVGANDRGTAELGRNQVELDLTANGLIRPGDQTRFTVVVPTDIERFQYYALSHSELLDDDGLTASANVGYLRTRPASIPLHGSAITAGVALSYPIIRSNVTNLTVTASVDGVNSDNALFGQLVSDDHTRAARIAASFSRTFARLTIAASGTASFGLNILGAEVTSPELSDQTFKKLNLRFGADEKITRQLTLRLRSIGQYSGDRLPAVEQIALGGDEFGRAFESALVIGDSGVAGSAELAYSPRLLPSLVKGSEVYGFVDGGEVWSQDRVILPAETETLSSTGFGARLAVAQKAMFQLEAAEALKEPLPQMHNAWRVVFGYKSLY